MTWPGMRSVDPARMEGRRFRPVARHRPAGSPVRVRTGDGSPPDHGQQGMGQGNSKPGSPRRPRRGRHGGEHPYPDRGGTGRLPPGLRLPVGLGSSAPDRSSVTGAVRRAGREVVRESNTVGFHLFGCSTGGRHPRRRGEQRAGRASPVRGKRPSHRKPTPPSPTATHGRRSSRASHGSRERGVRKWWTHRDRAGQAGELGIRWCTGDRPRADLFPAGNRTAPVARGHRRGV